MKFSAYNTVLGVSLAVTLASSGIQYVAEAKRLGRRKPIAFLVFGDSQTDTGEDSYGLGLQDLVEAAAVDQTSCETCAEIFVDCTCKTNCKCNVEFDFAPVPEGSDDAFPFHNGYYRGSATNEPGTWAKQLSDIANVEEFSFAFQAAEALEDRPFNILLDPKKLVYGPQDDPRFPYKVPGPKSQVELFIESKLKLKKKNAIAVFFGFGANDISRFANDKLSSFPLDFAQIEQDLAVFIPAVFEGTKEGVQELREAEPDLPIVIGGLTALNKTPRFLLLMLQIGSVDPVTAVLLEQVLKGAINSINQLLNNYATENENIFYVDLFDFTENLGSSFNVADQPCAYLVNDQAPFQIWPFNYRGTCDPYLDEPCEHICTDKDAYRWYDEIHSSAAANKLIAQHLIDEIKAFGIPNLDL